MLSREELAYRNYVSRLGAFLNIEAQRRPDRYRIVFCSQCGREFQAANTVGFSSCDRHAALRPQQ